MDINQYANQINIEMFASRLCEEIERKGYTKKQFAELINITATALQNITLGKNLPSLQNYVSMCEVLKIPFGYLLRDSIQEPELISAMLDGDLADIMKDATVDNKRMINKIAEVIIETQS